MGQASNNKHVMLGWQAMAGREAAAREGEQLLGRGMRAGKAGAGRYVDEDEDADAELAEVEYDDMEEEVVGRLCACSTWVQAWHWRTGHAWAPYASRVLDTLLSTC